MDPCYKVMSIIRKTGYRDSDYFTRIRLIGLIDTKIFNILYNVYFLGNFVYLFTDIEFSGFYTLPPLFKKF